MTDLADAAQAIEEAERASALARQAAAPIGRDGTCLRCDRAGSRVIATVESVKIKNAIVNSNGHRYRVPCNMLEI